VVLFEESGNQPSRKFSYFLFKQVAKLHEIYGNILKIETINCRPTYEDIFKFANKSLEDDIITVIANADIYFDETLSKVKQVDLEKSFLILTRRELSKNCSLIKEYKNGLPNYFSADTWIFQTPLRQDFKATYKIGTFFCDSFLNNQLSKSSNYLVYNPCFSINSYHLHDESFNSS
ncbi:MAG: hypothetical protein ACKPFF_27485, partial [Planktothrix sp.]